MNIITGYTADWTDPNTGVNYPTAWIRVRQTNYSALTSCFVVTDVYKDEGSYPGMKPIAENIMPIVLYDETPDSIWMTYFDTSIMDEPNHNIQNQSISYLQSQIAPLS